MLSRRLADVAKSETIHPNQMSSDDEYKGDYKRGGRPDRGKDAKDIVQQEEMDEQLAIAAEAGDGDGSDDGGSGGGGGSGNDDPSDDSDDSSDSDSESDNEDDAKDPGIDVRDRPICLYASCKEVEFKNGRCKTHHKDSSVRQCERCDMWGGSNTYTRHGGHVLCQRCADKRCLYRGCKTRVPDGDTLCDRHEDTFQCVFCALYARGVKARRSFGGMPACGLCCNKKATGLNTDDLKSDIRRVVERYQRNNMVSKIRSAKKKKEQNDESDFSGNDADSDSSDSNSDDSSSEDSGDDSPDDGGGRAPGASAGAGSGFGAGSGSGSSRKRPRSGSIDDGTIQLRNGKRVRRS